MSMSGDFWGQRSPRNSSSRRSMKGLVIAITLGLLVFILVVIGATSWSNDCTNGTETTPTANSGTKLNEETETETSYRPIKAPKPYSDVKVAINHAGKKASAAKDEVVKETAEKLESVKNKGAHTAQGLYGGVKDQVEKVGGRIGEMKDKVVEGVQESVNNAAGFVEDTKDKVVQNVQDGAEKLAEKAAEYKDEGRNLASDYYESAKAGVEGVMDKGRELKDKGVQAANNFVEDAQETAENAVETVSDKAGEVKKSVGNAAEHAVNKANEMKENGKKLLEDTFNNLHNPKPHYSPEADSHLPMLKAPVTADEKQTPLRMGGVLYE